MLAQDERNRRSMEWEELQRGEQRTTTGDQNPQRS